MMNKKIFSRLATLVAVAMLAPLMAVAQDDGPGYLQVRTMTVKQGRQGDFMRLQSEFAKAAKAAGMSRDFWSEIRGHSGTYHSVMPLNTLADNDDGFQPPMDEDAWGNWIAAFSDTLSDMSYQVLRLYPGHNIPLPDGTAENLMLLRYRTVQPGKNTEYRSWIENDLLPAIREGDYKGFSYVKIHQGGNPGTWISASRYASWEDMETPGLFAHMSDRDRSKLLEKGSEYVWESEVKILSYNAALSY